MKQALLSIGNLLLGPDKSIPLLLFFLALVLYLPGIWWGLPQATAPDRIGAWGSDELAPLGPIAELYSVATRSEKFNPQYPLFEYVMQAIGVGPYILFAYLTGSMTHFSAEYPYGFTDPVRSLAMMALLARLMNLLMAAGVVMIAFRTATIVWDRRTGILAGFLVMGLYPMFYYARTSNVDMGALFWTSLGVLVFAAILREGLNRRRAVFLGVCAALATATKDPSYAVFVVLGLTVAWWALRGQPRVETGSSEDRGGRPWSLLGVGLLASVLVYAVASGLVFHPERYIAHVQFITEEPEFNQLSSSYYSTPATLSGYVSLLGKIFGHIVDAMGLPMALCAPAGLALCALRSPRALALALPALGILLGVILPVRFVRLRFVIVVAYALALFAAYALNHGLSVQTPLLRRAAQGLVVVVCGWALLRGADLTYQMIYDARYEVSAWFEEHAEAGETVGYYGSRMKLLHLPSGITTVPMPGQMAYNVPYDSTAGHPEFVVVIPQWTYEPVHEITVSEEDYQALRDGSRGYEQVLGLQTHSLFAERPVTFVNPPVKVFVRKDHLAKLPGLQPRIEVDH